MTKRVTDEHKKQVRRECNARRTIKRREETAAKRRAMGLPPAQGNQSRAAELAADQAPFWGILRT